MNTPSSYAPASSPLELAERILLRGIHLTITPALRALAIEKGARLLRHQTRLVRIRFDIEHDHANTGGAQFVAKGHVEISGPDLIASAASEDAYKSLDLLIDKLDRMLRERTRNRADRRNDRAEGTEFRDRFAEISSAATTVSANEGRHVSSD